jgi:hypothetical protein
MPRKLSDEPDWARSPASKAESVPGWGPATGPWPEAWPIVPRQMWLSWGYSRYSRSFSSHFLLNLVGPTKVVCSAIAARAAAQPPVLVPLHSGYSQLEILEISDGPRPVRPRRRRSSHPRRSAERRRWNLAPARHRAETNPIGKDGHARSAVAGAVRSPQNRVYLSRCATSNIMYCIVPTPAGRSLLSAEKEPNSREPTDFAHCPSSRSFCSSPGRPSAPGTGQSLVHISIPLRAFAVTLARDWDFPVTLRSWLWHHRHCNHRVTETR